MGEGSAAYDDAVQETASGLQAGAMAAGDAGRSPSRRRTVVAVLAGVVLFTAAALYPRLTGIDVHAGWTGWPPLAAAWRPRVGWGTLPALALAAAVVVLGTSVAARLSWGRLLLTTWATAWL